MNVHYAQCILYNRYGMHGMYGTCIMYNMYNMYGMYSVCNMYNIYACMYVQLYFVLDALYLVPST